MTQIHIATHELILSMHNSTVDLRHLKVKDRTLCGTEETSHRYYNTMLGRPPTWHESFFDYLTEIVCARAVYEDGSQQWCNVGFNERPLSPTCDSCCLLSLTDMQSLVGTFYVTSPLTIQGTV